MRRVLVRASTLDKSATILQINSGGPEVVQKRELNAAGDSVK